MRRLIRWIAAVSTSGALLLAGRWSFAVAKPADDLATVARIWGKVADRIREYWSILWRAYGPVTDDMRARWQDLRDRYTCGAYGTEGT